MNQRTLGNKLIICHIPVGLVCGVNIQPQLIHGGAEGVSGVVELDNSVLIFFVPHKLPSACIGLIHHICVIDNAHNAVGIGHRIKVFGIIVKISEIFVDVLIVGNVVEIQRLKKIFLRHSCNHIVGRNNDVIADRTAGNLIIHILV